MRPLAVSDTFVVHLAFCSSPGVISVETFVGGGAWCLVGYNTTIRGKTTKIWGFCFCLLLVGVVGVTFGSMMLVRVGLLVGSAAGSHTTF